METVQAVLPYPNIDPVIFSIGPVAIHWYGLAYVVGILLGWRYARRVVSTNRLWAGGKPAMMVTDMDDFLLWAAVGIVAGGRVGYMLFYDWPTFAANPLSILEVWNGGMSFHGGLIGTILAMFLFARVRGISAWSLFDVIAASTPLGLLLGRIANFINGELWGKTTDVPWAMVFPTGGPEPRHPSQLYESFLEGLVLFVLLAFLIWRMGKLKSPGFVSGAFLAGYAVSRILVEFVRQPDVQIGYLYGGWLTMGMILSTPMLLLGVVVMAMARPAATEPAAGTPDTGK